MAAKSNDLPMPKGLLKSERSAVLRVIDMRNSAGDPVCEIEIDTVLDYCRARARLAKLEAELRRGVRVTSYSQYDLNLAERLTLNAAIERAAASCRRLARDLRLFKAAA